MLYVTQITQSILFEKGYFNKGAPVQAHSKLKVRFFLQKGFQLTDENNIELSLVRSVLAGSYTSVISLLVKPDGWTLCCIHQHCGVPYYCCVYGRCTSNKKRHAVTREYPQNCSWQCYFRCYNSKKTLIGTLN